MALHIATPTELTIIRSEPQWSEWYLAGWEMPPTIFSARVNQVFADDDARDQVAQVTYDAGVGAFADVLPGMTLWIGSAAGLYDKGIARIRKAADAVTRYVAERMVEREAVLAGDREVPAPVLGVLDREPAKAAFDVFTSLALFLAGAFVGIAAVFYFAWDRLAISF